MINSTTSPVDTHIEEPTVQNPLIAAAELVISIHRNTLEQIANGRCYVDIEGNDITDVVAQRSKEGIENSEKLLHEAPARVTQEALYYAHNPRPH